MFTRKDLERIFKETYYAFSRKHTVKCCLKFVKDDDFFYLSKQNKIVAHDILEGVPILVGALVRHSTKEDAILMNVDVINQITDDRRFVKAVVMHEFFHILLKSQVKANTLSEEVESEIRAKETMAREFPSLSKYIV